MHKMKAVSLSVLFSLILPITSSHGTLPALPPLTKKMTNNCAEKSKECARLYAYWAKKEITDTNIEKYLKIGCDSNDLNACSRLGLFYLNRKKKDKKKAWEPLAKACFVNDNYACNTLRGEELLVPPYMSFKKDYGPQWPNHFKPWDVHIAKNQTRFLPCYKLRKGVDIHLFVRLQVKDGQVLALDVLESTFGNKLEKCFVEKLKEVRFSNSTEFIAERNFEFAKIYIMGTH